MTDVSLHHPSDEPALIWRTKKSGALVDHGRPMTLAEAMAYARGGAANSNEYEVLTPAHFRYKTGFGYRTDLVGRYPMPGDTDRAMGELSEHLRTLGMNLTQRDLIMQAVQAALDAADGLTGSDQEALDLLTQLLATPLPEIG